MTTINIGGAPSYTIPLDSLDLAYLVKYVHTPREEKMPLWTKKRLDGESEYCQVQIVTRGNNNEDCYSETSDTYQCHICNINVPKMCYQKHNESDQHVTVKKIYQKVLERVSKQINLNAMNTDEDIDNDLYYCEPCSKMIKIENKNNHEATEYHAQSVKDVMIINEFHKIFNKNISIDVNEELLGEESDIFNLNDNYDIYDNKMEASSSIDSDDDSFDSDIIYKPPAPGHNVIETKIQSPKEEKKQNFEEYLKQMIMKYNLKVALPVVDGEFITIVTPNGNKIKVSREHFHGYTEKTNRMYCQLCNMWIFKDTSPHDVTEKHVHNIFRPINDKFARWVNNDWSHCVPCNELVLKDSDLHTLNDVHKKIIQGPHTPKTDKTLCEDCNLYIHTNNFSVHLNSKKHLNILMKQNSIQDTGNNNTFCKICNQTVPKHALKFHIGTKLHLARKTNVPTALSNKRNDCTEINDKNNKNNAPNEINDKKNESLATAVKITDAGFCQLCKVKVPGGGMKIHVNGRPHQSKVSQLRSANNEYKVEIGAKPSTSTNTSSYASTSRIYETVASTSTMSSLSNYTNETDHEDEKIDAYYDMTEFVDETRTIVRCKICSVNIVFVERNIIEHMEGRNHQNIEKANKQKLEAYNRLLFYADIEETKLKCQICDVHIPDIERNIIEHMEGRNHEFAENQLLKFHTITRESSEFICECCSIRTTDYIEHLNSRNHTLIFLEKYEIDKTEMRKYVYEENVNNFVARLHRVLYRNLLKHNGIFKLDDVNHYCGICQIKLSRISEIDHVLGERHKSQIEQVDKLSSLLEQLELTNVVRT